MGDQLIAELSAFVGRKLRKLLLAKLYPGTVKSQDATTLSVDVQPDDPSELGQSGFSGVQLALGLPGFRVKLPAGVKLRQWWDAWDPARPLAGLFDQGCPVNEVVFDGGTQAVARVDDAVQCGRLEGAAPSGGGPVVFTWTPSNGDPPIVATSIDIVGYISTGNSKFKA